MPRKSAPPPPLGDQVRAARKARGLTQIDLAAAIGSRQATISEIERGAIKSPSPETLRRLCAALGVSADYLLGLG